MPPVSTTESGSFRAYRKTAGTEPLPGYKLLSPLGRGGFGEVWRCEAPGGLHKAIKFVGSEAEDGRGKERFGQELAAFEQIKAIRHPFLLTLERVEQIDGELIMVMELADRQLQDRFNECCNCGLPGIPRDELLTYFADAAEALDVIAAKFNLQHLDIKPANLFLVSGHVKVGDYGLVAQLEGPDANNRGLTPRYVSPEVLHGAASNRSDQYSLALVYHELLTGAFPYPGRTPQQLMLQHVSGTPNLSALPPADRAAVARALEKKPEDRFTSCLAFVQALMSSGSDTALPSVAMNVRRARVDRSVSAETPPPAASGTDDYPGNMPSVSARADTTHPGPEQKKNNPEPTQSATLPAVPNLTVSGLKNPLPPLVTGSAKSEPPKAPPAKSPRLSTGSINFPPPTPAVDFTPPPAADDAEAGQVVLDVISSVVSVATLVGQVSRGSLIDSEAFAYAVVKAAADGGQAPQLPGDVGQLGDGTWVCQFPSTVPASVAPLKLVVLRDRWGVGIETPDPAQVVLRHTAGGGGFFGGRRYGYEVAIHLPTTGKPLGEVTVLGRTFGSPDQKCIREAADVLPKLLLEVRAQLANVPDRRKHPRITCGLPLVLYPVHSDGGIDAAVKVRCRDVSLGGIGFAIARSLQTKYVYAVFPDVPAVSKQAALIRLRRVHTVGGERHYGAQYRTDLS